MRAGGSPLPLLGFVAALGSLGTHLIVPALPTIASTLALRPATAALGISLYLMGMGLGQLVWGPASDTLGRRAVLRWGTAAFAAGSIAAAGAPAALPFLGGRFVQAFGAAATLVGARALLAEGPSAVADLAALSSVTLLSPALAPTLGGLLAGWVGWRAVLGLLAVLAGLAWAVLGHLPADPARSGRGGGAAALAGLYRRLLGDAGFRTFLIANCGVSAAFYMFLSGAPFLLSRRYGLAPPAIGLCLFFVGGGIIAGTLLARRLAARVPGRLLPGAAALLAASAVLLLAAGRWPGSAPWRLVAPMALAGIGSGLAMPPVLAGAIRAVPGLAGTGASLLGATQLLVSALLSAAMPRLGGEGVQLAGIALVLAGSAALLARAARRYPPPFPNQPEKAEA